MYFWILLSWMNQIFFQETNSTYFSIIHSTILVFMSSRFFGNTAIIINSLLFFISKIVRSISFCEQMKLNVIKYINLNRFISQLICWDEWVALYVMNWRLILISCHFDSTGCLISEFSFSDTWHIRIIQNGGFYDETMYIDKGIFF